MYPLPPPWPRKVSVSPPPPTSSTWRQTSHSASSPVRSFTYLQISKFYTDNYTYIYNQIYTHSCTIYTYQSILISTSITTYIYLHIYTDTDIYTYLCRPTGCGRPRTTCPRCRRWGRCRGPGQWGWEWGQPGAGARAGAWSWSTRCWALLGLIFSFSFLYLFQKTMPVYECRLDNLENENDDKMSKWESRDSEFIA